MQRARVMSLTFLALAALSACSDSTRDPIDPAIKGDPFLGRLAFEESCSGCHASRDGFDVKTFGFTDTTIIRRAVRHVDTATARDIVAYIRGLSAPQNNEKVRLFQPKGAALASDVEFATTLFGRDAWPEDITTAQLSAIDPRTVAVALQLPIWSDENANTDWMPDVPLPQGILNYSGSLVAGAIAAYRAAPTTENLVRAVNALNTADRATANVDAPCLLEDLTRARYRDCFDVRRWTSTLVALHMLRNGMNSDIGAQVHDVWWDVGNAARKSRGTTSQIANADVNWATWMYLGWIFDPSVHSTTYTGGGLKQIGLTRHATFVALRTLVARPKNSLNVYEDLVNAERFAPTNWVASVTSFGLRNLNERLTGGEKPAADQLASAVSKVNTVLTETYAKVGIADRAKIEVLGGTVLAALR